MPKLSIGGTNIEGVVDARVVVAHNNPKAPDPIPTMEWRLRIRLQNEDLIPKWAMAKQGADRFKKCELQIKHNNDQVAHTWTLLNAYVHAYEEVEHPGTDNMEAGEAGHFVAVTVRGIVPEGKDYTGENVMTVAKGEARTFPS